MQDFRLNIQKLWHWKLSLKKLKNFGQKPEINRRNYLKEENNRRIRRKMRKRQKNSKKLNFFKNISIFKEHINKLKVEYCEMEDVFHIKTQRNWAFNRRKPEIWDACQIKIVNRGLRIMKRELH